WRQPADRVGQPLTIATLEGAHVDAAVVAERHVPADRCLRGSTVLARLHRPPLDPREFYDRTQAIGLRSIMQLTIVYSMEIKSFSEMHCSVRQCIEVGGAGWSVAL